MQIILFLFFFCIQTGFSQNSPKLYSFFIAGHTYGRPGVDNIGLHPPFKALFPYIQNRNEIEFGVLLGDIVDDPSEQDWDEVDADLQTLGLPTYIAPGNHDMRDRALFESRYGNPYFHFRHKNDLFIILDPNIDEWNISGLQLDFVEQTLNDFADSVDNIFVFTHQFIWQSNKNAYANFSPNSFEGRAKNLNFWTEVEPLFHSLSKPVVFCAGDFGASSVSDDFFYDSYDNITFIGTGMGKGENDNFVVINVDSSKNISYELLCVDKKPMNCLGKLTDYQITGKKNEFIKLYPNPASSYFELELNSNKKATLQLLNTNGQIVYQQSLLRKFKHRIHLPIALKTGLYFVKIFNEENHYFNKLLIH